MTGKRRTISIGSLARKAGLNPSRIRYYEDIGLLPEAVRGGGDQRRYTEDDLKRLVFIKRCRDFGFSLKQVRELLGLSISKDRDCAEVGKISAGHLDEIREKIKELQSLEKALSEFVQECETVCCGGAGRECAIFEKIAVSTTAN